MLGATVYQLRALNNAELSLFHGMMVETAVLDLIGRQDECMAAGIEEMKYSRPITASLLQIRKTVQEDKLSFAVDDNVWWRITTLDGRIGNLLGQGLVGQNVQFGAAKFLISKVFKTPAEDEDANQEMYGALVDKWLQMPVAQLGNRVGLRVVSPTSFQHGELAYPFLDPEKVWLFLWEQWQKWSDLECPWQLDKFKENVFLASWQGKTMPLTNTGTLKVGCVGQFDYGVRGNDENWLRMLNLLADLAFYTGAGRKTSCGMGQVRKFNREMQECRQVSNW